MADACGPIDRRSSRPAHPHGRVRRHSRMSSRSSSTSPGGATSTSSRSRITNGSTRRSPAGRSPQDRGLAVDVVVGEEVTTLGGHLLALFVERRDPAVPLARAHDRRHPRGRRHRHPGPPARPLSAVRPGLGPSAPPRRSGRRRPARRARDLQPDGARAAVARSGRALRRRSRTRPRRQQRRARARRRRDAAGRRFRRPDSATCGRPSRRARPTTAARSTARPVSSGSFGQQLRKRAIDARDELAGRVRRDGTGRDHGYPGGRARPPRYDPGPDGGREDRPRLPVHLPGQRRASPSTSGSCTRTSACAATTSGS